MSDNPEMINALEVAMAHQQVCLQRLIESYHHQPDTGANSNIRAAHTAPEVDAMVGEWHVGHTQAAQDRENADAAVMRAIVPMARGFVAASQNAHCANDRLVMLAEQYVIAKWRVDMLTGMSADTFIAQYPDQTMSDVVQELRDEIEEILFDTETALTEVVFWKNECSEWDGLLGLPYEEVEQLAQEGQ
jgi:hypothetical protein